MTVLLLQTLEQFIHQIDDHAEGEIEGDVEKLGDPRHSEEREETHEETDDGVAYCVDGLLDLLLVTGGEDERDTTEDDIDEAQDRSDHQAKSNDSRENLENRTIFDEVADHG